MLFCCVDIEKDVKEHLTQKNVKNILLRKNAQMYNGTQKSKRRKTLKVDFHYPRKLCSKKVVANADLANISLAPRRHTELGSWASGHNISITWAIHNPVLCVFVFKNTLQTVYCQLINIEHTADSAIAHAGTKLI